MTYIPHIQVDSALRELTDSDTLKTVLLHLLALGNFLNAGTPLGDAPGFGPDSLTKFASTRANAEVREVFFLVLNTRGRY